MDANERIAKLMEQLEHSAGNEGRLQSENQMLRSLIRVLVENDPNDLDVGGVTLLVHWREEAARTLHEHPLQ